MRTLVAIALLSTAVTTAAQTISSVFPGSGRPGDLVHIAGQSLLNSAAACAPLGCGAHVTIGGADASIVAITNTEVDVVAPDHPSGSADVTFTSAGFAPSTLAGAYTYEYANPNDYERMLVPVAGTTPGAFGSQWKATVSAYGDASTFLKVPYCPRGIVCGDEYFINAGIPSTFTVDAPATGAFLYVRRDLANAIDFVVHVFDQAHPADSNVDVPVVRARDFRSSVRLLDVPLATGVRSMLRVYGYKTGTVTVTARDADGHSLGTTSLSLQLQGLFGTELDFPTLPPNAATLVDALSGVAGQQSVLLEITSDSAAPIWAFVSVTNNDTQHVNVIVPHEH